MSYPVNKEELNRQVLSNTDNSDDNFHSASAESFWDYIEEVMAGLSWGG